MQYRKTTGYQEANRAQQSAEEASSDAVTILMALIVSTSVIAAYLL